MVSVEENGKSKKYRTYRDLESLKARKEQTEKLNKGSLRRIFVPVHAPRFRQCFQTLIMRHTAQLPWQYGIRPLNNATETHLTVKSYAVVATKEALL